MSIRINNKIIAGNGGEAKSTSYRYVGEIFQSAIPIDDIKVACLDGHKIYSDEGYGSFIQHLISQSVLYPQLVCTEEVWQEKVTQYGSWGQFVINTQENSVRLPKIAGFVQGLNTLEDLAGLLEAGLPNIEGSLTRYVAGNNNETSGALTVQANTFSWQVTSGSSQDTTAVLGFDASLSNSIYGNSDTVQPQAIQYPYYIVLATGVVQEINIKDEVHLNNPFFFGMYQYFETEPNNLSWLKSEGQWNIGDIYESFYKWLVESYNNTDSGVSVKLNTETYTNFDYVLNQNDKTFRLPIEVKQKFYNDISGSIPVAGNGMTLGITDGTNNYGLYQNSTIGVSMNTNLYGTEAGTVTGSTGNSGKNIGLTTDPTKSGIEAQITQTEVEGLGLYFYVGEVVQNANIINVSKLRDEVKELKDLITSDKEEGEEESSGSIVSIVEEYTNGNEGYRLYSNGYFEQWGYIEQLNNTSTDVTTTFAKPLDSNKWVDVYYRIGEFYRPKYTYTIYETTTYPAKTYYNQILLGAGNFNTETSQCISSSWWTLNGTTSYTSLTAIHPVKNDALAGWGGISWADSTQPYFKDIHWHVQGYILGV